MVVRLKKPLFLYGPPGVGKSTVGKDLAKNLNAKFIDLDIEIAASGQMSIEEIFNTGGEIKFRELESEQLNKISSITQGIISLGGGALIADNNREIAEKCGQVIVLNADVDTLLNRLGSNIFDRPLLSGNNLKKLLAEREEHYNSFQDQIQTTSLTSEEVAQEILLRSGIFLVSGMGEEYSLYLGSESLGEIGRYCQDHQITNPGVIITDDNVGKIYGDELIQSLKNSGYHSSLISIPAGEQSKNIETLNHLWQKMIALKLDRKSTVIALGGGVVTDIAGFAAATLYRGIDWVSVPTSLLAMVDASIGGKTGIDLPSGKNLAGAFHPPKFILSDPNLLTTLPKGEFSNGMAEVIKSGVIGDAELFKFIQHNNVQDLVKRKLLELLKKSIKVKIDIISQDAFEKGNRAKLNFGHTIGHALELLSDYKIKHGEAVAIGMVQETKLSEELGLSKAGLSKKIKNICEKFSLPTTFPAKVTAKYLIDAMMQDKKRIANDLHFSLPVTIGNVKHGIKIDNLESLLSNLLKD